jgi:hypothetical protein
LLHIAAGSELVLLLGEIDCREGLPVAVEKMKVRLVLSFVLPHVAAASELVLLVGQSACIEVGVLLDISRCGRGVELFHVLNAPADNGLLSSTLQLFCASTHIAVP